MVVPSADYGLLVDKAAQTMVVFEQGKRIGEMRISTGKPIRSDLTRETTAGSFLTVSRLGSFNTKGMVYGNPIRYDGGNLIHSIGWKKQGTARDYTTEQAQLGTKASHGCIRMPRFGEEGDITAYWLWLHIPWHTRLIILDDPAERAAQAEQLGVQLHDMPYTGSGTNGND